VSLFTSSSLYRAALNSLVAQIAVLDRDGVIIAVNDAWSRCGAENSDPTAAHAGVGVNYLDVFRQAALSGHLSAAQTLTGIQAVLNGSQPDFALEYPVDFLTEKRWYRMSVLPLADESGDATISAIQDAQGHSTHFLAVKEDITDRKQAQDALQRLTECLQIRHEIDGTILSAKPPQKIDTATLRYIRKRFPIQRASLWIIDEQTYERVLLAAVDDTGTLVVGERHPLEREWFALYRPAEPLIIDDLRTPPQPMPVFSSLLEQGILNLALVPLIVQDKLIGALALAATKPRACSEEHILAARDLADYLAVAIRQAQLYEAERDQRVFAEALRDSTAAINQSLALDDVLDRILINVERVVPHDACNIMLIDGDMARVVRARGFAERGLGDWIMTVTLGQDEIDEWRRMFVGEHPKPYTIADTYTDSNWKAPVETKWIRSTAKAPLQTGGELIGVLNLDSATPNFFTQQHLDRLQALAEQAVVAIRNAKLYQSEHERRILAETFRRVAEALSSTVQLDETLNLVIEQLARIIHYDHAIVMLVEDERMRVVAARDRSTPDELHDLLNSNWRYSDNALFHSPMTSGQPVVIEDTRKDTLWPEMPLPIHSQTRSWIGMPLVVWGVTIGFLSIGSNHSHAYRPSDVETVKALAQQVALAIESSRVYAQLETSITSLQHAEANLAQAARLSVAGEIATSIAHQVNNPLTAIVAHTHLLLKRRTPDSPDYRSLEIIREAAYRAGSVVQRLLSFARTSVYALQPVDVNQSIEYAASLIRAQIESDHAYLILELAPGLPMVNASAEHLEDVWINLILNAREAVGGREDGVIKISTRLIEGSKQIEIRVQDNGAGISPDVLPHIFVPMFTTKAHGTGLGLSVCHEVIQHHRGHINVSSQVGEGTTFIITLPCQS
jgi:C4-dicarboxylate-specific signal transduction histidine kinase